MNRNKHLRLESGQGFVSYALVLVLVSLVVIVAASMLGAATQRIYGVITGSLGSKHDTLTSHHSIEITTARCIAVQSTNLTGLWVVGITDEAANSLTGSTNLAAGTGLDGLPSLVEAMPPNGFKFHPLLAYQADLRVCPNVVVIQANDGAISFSPVEKVTAP